MKIRPTSLDGVWLVELEVIEDARGFFARTFCETEFKAQGLNTRWPQCNLTHTLTRGTLRGLHYQLEPKAEIKLVRCSAGSIYDVVVDVRTGSPSFGRWEAFELTSRNRSQLYVPAGFAHGFQCLEDSCEVVYQMSEVHDPSLARGVRWNDPAFKITWPLPDPFLSERDQNWPLLSPKS